MDTTTSRPLTALGAYRPALYRCFTRARDALFDLCDALATFPGARSFVELSQAPCFQRCWPSVYEAREDGRIDRTALRALFTDTAPRPTPGARQVRALDSSPIVRPYARTVPTRARSPTARWCMCPPPGRCCRRTARRCAPAGPSPR